jgi:malonyl-CoA/methylmalonyl-CoA synthetase
VANHLFQTIRDVAERQPESLFAEGPAAPALTYSGMLALSGRYAASLAALGATPGGRIAVQIEKSAEALLLYLGAIRAGAIFLPLNTAYTDAELAFFLTDVEPEILVCDPARLRALLPVAAKAGVKAVGTLGADGSGSLLDRCAACAEKFADVSRGPGDLAAILYTSGTTGRAKGTMLTHGNLLSNALVLADLWRFTPGDTLVHALPLYHAHGFSSVSTLSSLAAQSCFSYQISIRSKS